MKAPTCEFCGFILLEPEQPPAIQPQQTPGFFDNMKTYVRSFDYAFWKWLTLPIIYTALYSLLKLRADNFTLWKTIKVLFLSVVLCLFTFITWVFKCFEWVMRNWWIILGAVLGTLAAFVAGFLKGLNTPESANEK
ncbi:MAG: hypothetical protein NT118_13590 [Lentisphaerae bacterium]|nr:hypothetical protein [Lentisphaerota bacterium]